MAANLNIIDSDDEEFWQILDAYVDLEMTREDALERFAIVAIPCQTTMTSNSECDFVYRKWQY